MQGGAVEEGSGTVAPLRASLGTTIRVLVGLNVVIVVLHLVALFARRWFEMRSSYADVLGLFDMDREVAIPTWFNGSLFLASAALAAASGHVSANRGGSAREWRIVAAALLLASIDEVAAIHDKLTSPMASVPGLGEGLLRRAWIVPVALVVAVLVLFLRRWLQSLPSRTRSLFLLSAIAFGAASIGLEAVGGAYMDVDPSGRRYDLTHLLLGTLEETVELAAISLFLLAALAHLRDQLAGDPLSVEIVA